MTSDYDKLVDAINDMWLACYPGGERVSTPAALVHRCKMLSADWRCWVDNANILQRALTQREGERHEP